MTSVQTTKNTQEPKLKHTERRKERNRGRERETRREAEYPGGRRSRFKTFQVLTVMLEREVWGWPIVDHMTEEGGNQERKREGWTHSCDAHVLVGQKTNRESARCCGYQK